MQESTRFQQQLNINQNPPYTGLKTQHEPCIEPPNIFQNHNDQNGFSLEQSIETNNNYSQGNIDRPPYTNVNEFDQNIGNQRNELIAPDRKIFNNQQSIINDTLLPDLSSYYLGSGDRNGNFEYPISEPMKIVRPNPENYQDNNQFTSETRPQSLPAKLSSASINEGLSTRRDSGHKRTNSQRREETPLRTNIKSTSFSNTKPEFVSNAF